MKLTNSGSQAVSPAQPSGALPWLANVPRAGWERPFLVGLALLMALLMLPLLGRVPRVYGDDSWSTMAGYTLAFEGRPRNPGQMGRGGTDTYLVQPRLFPNVVCAAVYRLAGFGLTQARMVAVVFCGIFVFAVHGVMRRLFGPVAAAGIAVMTAVDPWVFITGRTCREEIFLAALLWLSWWFLLGAIDRRSAVRGFVGGLCIGLACWTHPNAVIFTTAGFVGLLAMAGFGKFKGWWLVCAVGGLVMGLAPYLVYVGYVESTSEVRVMDQVAARTGAYARSLMQMLAMEKARWMNFLRLPLRTPLLLLYLWGLAWALFRGRRGERLLLIFIVAAALLMPLLLRVGHGRYCVVLVPALAALVWRSLPRVGVRSGGAEDGAGPMVSQAWIGRSLAVGMMLVYMGMSLLPTVAVGYAHRKADYDAWVARVARHIPPHASVMAHTMYWTGLHDRRFISSIPPYYSDWRTVEDAVAHIDKHHPEYLVQSSILFGGVGGLGPRKDDLHGTVFGQACEQVAARGGARVLDEFYERDFGRVKVWKIE
ncbi:MAG: glycosyltransferase family 39 protein [Phycisphaerae bacterium]|nr:glycosyltransferase family 39 protein [Phycisphaerae bacterium]